MALIAFLLTDAGQKLPGQVVLIPDLLIGGKAAAQQHDRWGVDLGRAMS